MCRGKPEHSWPRGGSLYYIGDNKVETLSYSYGALYANGQVTISLCNDCLATKVRFFVDQKDGSRAEEETIVEPPFGI